jgi:CRISPR-associated endonuclease Csn1
MRTNFGFDLGTTSVGFAVVELDESGNPSRLARIGTRAFEETRAGKKLETKNKERRTARLMRRQIRRRRWRRIKLGRALAEAGLLPAFGSGDWRVVMALDPYRIRAAAPERALGPHEIGRALYHLAKRRGFRFPRPEETERRGDGEDAERQKEEGVTRQRIASLRAEMGTLSLGAHLAKSARKRGKELQIGRDMVEAEFEAIWQAQAGRSPDLLTPGLHRRLQELIFFQRPTFWRVKTLGQCRLVPGAQLCLKGSWVGQQFVMLKELNNLRVVHPETRPLEPHERLAAVAALQSSGTRTFGALRKAMKIRGATFNYEEGKAKHMRGNATEAALHAVFGRAWDVLPARERLRAEIAERLWHVNYRQLGNKRIEIRTWEQREAERANFVVEAQHDYDLTAEQAAALSELNLPVGWLRFSEAAVRRLVPHLEAGLGESDALDVEFAGHRDAAPGSDTRLPTSQQQMPDIRNPTVTRTLNELRKVVNNLLRQYGKPDAIRIELARDLKLPPSERLRMRRDNLERERVRDQAAAALRERNVKVSAENIDKWLLWEECGRNSPYTGDKIGFDALFNRGEFQVDHIWPRSRSFDNGLANKVLAEAEINRVKGDRTPFEYLRDTGGDWDEFRRRVSSLGLPAAKVRRLLNTDLEAALSDELAERQLRDTSYTAVAARQFLERLGVPVGTTNGRVTAHLSRQWGLYAAAFDRNTKDRTDLRHHAIDALAVALTTPGIVKRLSDHYGRELTGRAPQFAPPWPALWQETRAWAERMVVSHRVQRKVSGPLHAENSWRHIGADPEDPRYERYGVRKPIASIKGDKKKSRERIPDPVVAAYVERLKSGGKDAAGGESLGFPTPTRTRVHIKQQPALVVPLRPAHRVYADKSEYHHMALYGRNGRFEDFRLASTFEAARRVAAGQPAVSKQVDGPDGLPLPLIFSLARGDLLELAEAPDVPRFVLVQGVWDSGVIELSTHRSAQREIWRRPNARSLLENYGARKIAVDPIGRERYPRD